MKNILIYLFAAVLLITSCSKIKNTAPKVTITTSSLTYKTTDSVIFNISGNADYIYFFSGETGRDYSKRNTFSADSNGRPEFSFSSNVQFGTLTINNLSVMASTDFNGVYDTTNVKKATWTDITSRATLSTGNVTTVIPSGTISLNDLKVADKPMYIAYKYLSTDITQKQRQWSVTAFKFVTRHADGEIYTNAADNASAGFTPVEFKGDSAKFVVGSTSLTHVGLAAGYPLDNDWAISKAFNLKSQVGDAAGVVTIKNYSTGYAPTRFAWRFNTPGTYKVVFIARNATSDSSADTETDITLTITP